MTSQPDPDRLMLQRQHPPQILYSDMLADRPMSVVADLAIFLGGSGDSFTGELLLLMRKADRGNRYRLALSFPWHSIALDFWEAMERPTYGQLHKVWLALITFTETGIWHDDSEKQQPGDSTPG